MALIDSVVTFEGEQLGFFLKPLLEEPTLQRLGWQTYFGQVDKYGYFHGDISKITKKKTACGHTAADAGLSITRKLWSPVDLEAFDKFCSKDFDDTIFAQLRKGGNANADLTGTDIANAITAIWGNAVMRDFLRIILLADTALADADYSMLDGWYKKLGAQVPGGQNYGVVSNTAINETNIQATLEAIFQMQTRIMRNVPAAEKAFYVTGTVFDAWQNMLITNEDSESSRAAMISGNIPVTYRGVELIPLYIVDEFGVDVDATESPVAFATPNRIVLAKKDQTALLLSTSDAGKEVDIWYDKDEDFNKCLTNYRADVQIGYTDFFVIAGLEAA